MSNVISFPTKGNKVPKPAVVSSIEQSTQDRFTAFAEKLTNQRSALVEDYKRSSIHLNALVNEFESEHALVNSAKTFGRSFVVLANSDESIPVVTFIWNWSGIDESYKIEDMKNEFNLARRYLSEFFISISSLDGGKTKVQESVIAWLNRVFHSKVIQILNHPFDSLLLRMSKLTHEQANHQLDTIEKMNINFYEGFEFKITVSNYGVNLIDSISGVTDFIAFG